MSRIAALFLGLLVLACDSGSSESGNETSEPTLEELIEVCEDVAECAACPSERQAIEDWQATEPAYELDCSEECVQACEMTGENCDGSGFAGCVSDCSDARTADYDAWTAAGDGPISDLDSCTGACVGDGVSETSCNGEPLSCAEWSGLGSAAGGQSCDAALTEIYG